MHGVQHLHKKYGIIKLIIVAHVYVVQFFPGLKYFLNQFIFDFPLFQIMIMNTRQRKIKIELV